MPSPLELSAWLAHWHASSLKSFAAQAHRLRRVYPAWYVCSDSGEALRRPDAGADARARLGDIAGRHGVEVWALVSNSNPDTKVWDAEWMHRIVHDKAAGGAQIDSLISLARADEARGLDLDYECLLAGDRDALTDFVGRLCAAAHAAGLKVGMPVHAKGAEPGEASGSAAQDYAGLARHVDLLQLMAYDFHWSSSGPGPIAPPDWAGRVLRHALSQAPKDKIEFGFPSYGYDWLGRQGQPLRFDDWQALVAAKGPARRDADTAELCLAHEGREAWFVDSVAMLRKLLQAREAGVGRASFWVLGSEDPRMWEMLESFPETFALNP